VAAEGKRSVTESVDNFPWDVLLASIEEGRVVPVVGPELLVFDRGGQQLQLHELLAELLKERLGIDGDATAGRNELNRVASQFLESGGQRGMLYSTLHALLAALEIPTPTPLAQLARVRGLKLFVSTTFDPFMQRALDEARFGGGERTQSRVYSLRTKVEDLPCEPVELDAPLVFQIFGRSSTVADYAITDEDLLEFVHALQTVDRRPRRLFDAMRDYNLLVLGCSFPNWLTRFFVRALSDMRLLDPRATLETIADNHTAHDEELVEFLRQCKLTVYKAGGTAQFVEELCRRWEAEHPAGEAESSAKLDEAPAPADIAPGGIFLSYASQDRDAVLALKASLESAGLEVWYDQRRLEAGDLYEKKIKRNIEACTFFFPIISANACRRLEGYYRKEWFWAIERSKRFESSYPFIQPIVVDEVPYDAKGIPEEFANRHWQSFQGGVPKQDFLELTKRRIRDLRKRQAGRT
jgi:hypothetical protein